MFDLTALSVLADLKLAGTPKVAFTPSPALEQALMSGGDPSGGGMPPGAGPGGPPPGGGDPSVQPPGPAGPGGAPAAGPDPSGGAPAPAPPPDPGMIQAIQQAVAQAMQQGGQPGAAGPGGKPATASVKFEPAHFQQMAHKISAMESILRQMADAMGLQVPASELFNVPAPGQPVPGTPGAPPADPAAAGGAPGAAPGGAQPPGSNIAQQLPSLPPVAGPAPKAAAARPVRKEAVDRLAAGLPVGRRDGSPVSDAGRLASLLATLHKAA